MATPAYNNMQNQNWPAIVYRLKLSGTFVYLPENNMLGFIHPSERYSEPRLGKCWMHELLASEKLIEP